MNINRAGCVGWGMPAFRFPSRPTAEEQAAGCLSNARLRELVAAGKHLRKHGSVEEAAAWAGLEVASYRRNWAELTKLAGWKHRTPEDFLAERATQRGGWRGKPPRVDEGLDARFSKLVSTHTAGLLAKALEKFDGTANDFLREAAERFLAAKSPW